MYFCYRVLGSAMCVTYVTMALSCGFLYGICTYRYKYILYNNYSI